MRALDQSNRKIQFAPKCVLARQHFTVVDLVIVTCQMQQPMQDENLHFGGQRMSDVSRIGSGNLKRNRDVSGDTWNSRRKGEHVGRLVLAAITAVQVLHFAA